MLKCDYLSFTFKPSRLSLAEYDRIEKFFVSQSTSCIVDEYEGVTDFDYFLEVFPEIKKHINAFTMVAGSRHYRRRHCFNDCMYIYDDDGFNGVKGVNVEIPSHGLYLIKEWFDLDDNDYLRGFLRILFKRACSLSRLDVCVDVPTSSCNIRPIKFFEWFVNHQLKTHYRCLEAVNGNPSDYLLRTILDGAKGTTFYLGDRHHQILRVYDKDVESKGKIDAIRFEIETHREKANKIATEYLRHEFSFKSLLLDMVDVLILHDPCKDNRSRISRDPEWEEFLNSCLTNDFEEVYQPEPKCPPSVRDSIAWAKKIFPRILELEFLSPELRTALTVARNSFVPSEQLRCQAEHLMAIGQYR